MRLCVLGFSLLLLSLATAVRADSISDTLTAPNTNLWVLFTNQPMYTETYSAVGVTFARSSGGTNGFQYVNLASLYVAQGDFSVQVNYTNASIAQSSGGNGNQIQLDARFGGQDFFSIRSCESGLGGQNAHVYLKPPTDLQGTRSWTPTSDTLKIVRTGTLVQGYIDSTLLYQANFNTNDATFAITLQNNGTSDATAVTFNNFQLTANHFVKLPTTPAITRNGNASVTVSWPDQNWPDYLANYSLQSTGNLANTNSWQPASPTLTGSQFLFTTPSGAGNQFFRLSQGPMN